MKSPVEKTTPPNCCPAEKAVHTEGTKGTEVFLIPTDCRAGASPARFLGSATGAVALHIVLLAVLVCAFCVSASSLASPAKSPGCTAAKKGRRLAKQNRHILPDSSPNDLDDADGGLDDVSATTVTRHDQDAPWFTTTTLTTIALHEPGFVPVFLFSNHSSDSPREHTRERAPPSA